MKYVFQSKTLKKYFLYIILSFFTTIHTINSTIILFIDKYPKIKIPKNKETRETLSKKLKQPNYLWKNMIKPHLASSGAQGVMALHLGNVCLSNKDGQTIFPRTFQEPVVHLLITKDIQPVYMVAPATVHNWMLDKKTPAELYKFKFSKDKETELYYIETTKVPLPKDLMISLDTIIIAADPKDVFVPLGATITHYSANLILPTIYIKKSFDFSYNALYTNSIKQYFESIKSNYKPELQTIAKILMNT